MQPDTSRVNDDAASEVETPPVGKKIQPSLPDHGDMIAPKLKRGSSFGKLWPPLILLVLIALGILLWLRHDELLDKLRLQGYTPSADLQQLVNDTAMTPYARRLFYVNHPALEDKAQFNQDCPNASQEVAVLGCFRGDRQGIYVYQVTDKRLNGIQQVTAAHEMLHQAYERLSAPEKKRINTELQNYAATITDTALKDKLDAYRKLEPDELANEMHSIFGTEVANLPPALETYYQQYFTTRQDVLAMHDKYQSAFTQRQQQIAAYDAQLATLNNQISAAKTDLKSRESALQSQRAQMEAWLKSDQTDRYNAAVPAYNASVEVYKQKVTDINLLINQYNDLIDKRNAIAVEEQTLIKAQDSNAEAPANAQ